MVKDTQVTLLRQKRMDGKTEETAAAVADMSVRTARKWETGPLPSETKQDRTWRTREDPFGDVWDVTVVPLLKSDTEGKLQAASVLGELQRREPGRFVDGQVRTLERRMRDWRAWAAVRTPARAAASPRTARATRPTSRTSPTRSPQRKPRRVRT